MPTNFDTNFMDNNNDPILANHVAQYAQPINDLENDVDQLQTDVAGKQPQNSNLDQISSQTMTKGDLLVHDGTGVTKLNPGSNGQILQSNSATSSGVEWVAPSSAGASQLSDLSDVESPLTPADGEILQYDNANSQFESRAPSEAGLVEQSRSVNVSAPLTGGGNLGSDLTIGMPQATGSTDGFLSASDHTAFSGKQDQSNNLDQISSQTMAKGDILVHDGTGVTKLNPGSNGQVLQANSAASSGVEWASAGASQLSDLSDIESPLAPSDGDILQYDNANSQFESRTPSEAGLVEQSRQVNVSGPLTGGGQLSSDISIGMNEASGSQDGYLSATDHATFSGKQNMLTSSADVPGLTTELTAKEDKFNKGVADGYAGLDSEGKVPLSQLPETSNEIGDIILTSREEPTDYLKANGQVVSQSVYSDLFAVTGLLGGSFPATTWNIESEDPGSIGKMRYLNGTFVACSIYAQIWLSDDDGANWSYYSLPSQRAQDITYAEDLGLYVACGNNNTISTSPDGQSWTARTVPGSSSKYSITYSQAAGLFVCGGYSGTLVTSPDGINWTSRTSGLAFISASTYGNGVFVIGDFSGQIATSPDGITWTFRTTLADDVYELSYVSDWGLFVATCASGYIYTSPDGMTWTSQTSPSTQYLTSHCYVDGKLLVGGSSGDILVSSNGTSWSIIFDSYSGWITGIGVSEDVILTTISTSQVWSSPKTYPYNSSTQFKLPNIETSEGYEMVPVLQTSRMT